MSDIEKPNFYAILPANVRYDKNIPPNAKLFYAEITSILQHNNRCYASNSYFSRVFNITEIQVSRIIKKLLEAGYILVDYKATSKGTQRFIALNINVNTPLNINDKTPLNINVKHNNNSINNTNSSTIVEENVNFGTKEFKQKLLDMGCNNQHVCDWMKVRKTKKASNTLTAFNKLINECNRHNYSVKDAVKICAEKSWSGFNHQWVLNDKKENEESQVKLSF